MKFLWNLTCKEDTQYLKTRVWICCPCSVLALFTDFAKGDSCRSEFQWELCIWLHIINIIDSFLYIKSYLILPSVGPVSTHTDVKHTNLFSTQVIAYFSKWVKHSTLLVLFPLLKTHSPSFDRYTESKPEGWLSYFTSDLIFRTSYCLHLSLMGPVDTLSRVTFLQTPSAQLLSSTSSS